MRQDFRAIDAAPTEGINGQTVKLVPANFRGHETGNVTESHNLWQRGAIPKDIGQPDQTRCDAELLTGKACAMHNLADQRFAGGQIAVGFDPHRAHRLKASLGHALFDARVDLRDIFFEPLQ